MRILTAFTVALLLAACKVEVSSSDDGSALPTCNYIAGGGTTTLAVEGCALCTLSNPGEAIDGNPATWATLSFPAGAGGTLALRSVAQEGVVFPSGSRPGAIISAESTAGTEVFNLGPELRAYYQGAPVSVGNIGGLNGIGPGPSRSPSRVSGTAVDMYDSVEISYNRGGSLDETVIHIHEFCSD